MAPRTYRLVGPDGVSYASTTKGTLGGHRRSRIYGRLDCPGALRALARGGPYATFRVFFADEATAIQAGYRPCWLCMRAEYMVWKRGFDRTASPTLGLRDAVKLLVSYYGRPTPPPTTDVFELVLLENIAYLAAPARRREAFELLRTTIGTSPEALLAATRPALERVTAKGVLKANSAAKLKECARIAVGEFDGDVNAATDVPLEEAKRVLRTFPSIGEPGAEKILLLAGKHALLAADSNVLRVLVRLGLIREDASYARMYAASQSVSKAIGNTVAAMQTAHLVLQQHGQTLCRRTAPKCLVCPLARGCAFALGVRPSLTT